MALAWSSPTLTIGFAAIRGAAVGALSLVSQHVISLWFVTRRVPMTSMAFACLFVGMIAAVRLGRRERHADGLSGHRGISRDATIPAEMPSRRD
ncbi:MAG: hypothetical protein FJZ38_22920 [Candidatus Rokubacteria bacterium]|nr:hypothetical protein [Candidatus Rokubacteria bacterium]